MMIKLNNVSKKYRTTKAVEDVSFQIAAQEVVAIIGPSGSGKSTLLRLIAGLEQADQGTISLFDVDITKAKRDEKRITLQKLGFIFQDFALFDHLNVNDNLALAPRHVYKKKKADINAKISDLLSQVGLLDKIDAYPSELSGGQKQRIAIARALATNPKMILFDEPTSALDHDAIEQLGKIIRDLNKQGVTILVVTHDLVFAKSIATRLLFMEKSRIINDEVNLQT